MARADVLISNIAATQWQNQGTFYPVETNNGDLYVIFQGADQDVYFVKSTNGGLTWSVPTLIFTGSASAMAVWYDRWSGIAAGLIHIAYNETATDDTFYRTIDTDSSDALSTQTVIFAGTTVSNACSLSICRARGGNVYCSILYSATEEGFFRLPTANVPAGAWDAALATVFESAAGDQCILMPGFAADTNDMLAIFMDASANEITRKIYDDSGNAWSEASGTIMAHVEVATATNSPHFAAAPDLTGTRVVFVGWTQTDLLNADLLAWTVTESAITAVGDVVTNSVDDQGFAGVGIDTSTGAWYVAYGGKSDGSETFTTALNIYAKSTTDSGTTWGAETLWSGVSSNLKSLLMVPRFARRCVVLSSYDETLDTARLNIPYPISAKAVHQLIGG